MKYSLCIETCFPEVDFYDRIPLAKELGFDAVEFYNPADYDADKLAAVLKECGMPVAICGMYNGFSERLTGDVTALAENLEKGIAFGKKIGCNLFTGHVCQQEIDDGTAAAQLVSNLKKLAPVLERENVTIAIEILNSKYEAPGYLLDTTEKAVRLLNEVGSPNVKILNDIFHTQQMEGDLYHTIRSSFLQIGHFHAASVPNRDELFNGEVNYRWLVGELDKLGYTGYVGMEYWPSYDHRKSYTDVLKYLKD